MPTLPSPGCGGSYAVTRVTPLHDDVAPDQVLRLAAALAVHVSHPVAAALVTHAHDAGARPLPDATEPPEVGKDGVVIGSAQALGVTSVSGLGVAGQVRTAHSGPHLSHRVLVGTVTWVLEELRLTPSSLPDTTSARLTGAAAEAERRGEIAVVVAWNASPQAVVSLGATT